MLFVGVHELDRMLVDPIKDALLDFELPLLVLFIRAIDLVLTPFVVKCIVTFVAQTLRINLAVSVSTLRSFVIPTVHVVAIVAHAFSVVLRIRVLTFGNTSWLHRSSCKQSDHNFIKGNLL